MRASQLDREEKSISDLPVPERDDKQRTVLITVNLTEGQLLIQIKEGVSWQGADIATAAEQRSARDVTEKDGSAAAFLPVAPSAVTVTAQAR